MQRTYFPGSEWIYLKIYTGVKSAEDILIEDIPFITRKLQQEQLIDKWFFIRYSDTDFHLRIRFLAKEKQHVGRVIDLLYLRLNCRIKDNTIWKIQIDTYNRELERYGNQLIEEAESVFHYDSESIVNLLKKLNRSKNENYRWMIALKMIDSLLSDFQCNLLEKQELMITLSTSFKTEFGFNEHNSTQFNDKFRENKPVIEAVLNNTINDNDFSDLYSPIKQRTRKMRPIVLQIQAKLSKNNTEIKLEALLSSYIHMLINRLFRSRNRIHELLLYDFMRRYYTSKVAKGKYKPEEINESKKQ